MPTTDVTITITTPVGVPITQVVDTLSSYWGYQLLVPDDSVPPVMIPNPQTKGQFVKARLAQFAKESYRAAKVNAGRETGGQAAGVEADTVVVT